MNKFIFLRLRNILRACLKKGRQPVFVPKPVWLGATREHTQPGSVTEEQQRPTGLGAKTLRAAVLLSVGFVGSVLTARSGDARTSPPRPPPKSPAAGHLPFFRQALIAFVCAECCISLVAAGQLKGDDQVKNITSTNTNIFELTVAVTSNVLKVGQPIELNIILRNISTNTVFISASDGLMNYSFKIIDSHGDKSQTTDYGNQLLHPAMLYNRSFEDFAPNQVLKIQVPLNKLFVMTNTGEYTIVVSRDTTDGNKTTANAIKIRLVN